MKDSDHTRSSLVMKPSDTRAIFCIGVSKEVMVSNELPNNPLAFSSTEAVVIFYYERIVKKPNEKSVCFAMAN